MLSNLTFNQNPLDCGFVRTEDIFEENSPMLYRERSMVNGFCNKNEIMTQEYQYEFDSLLDTTYNVSEADTLSLSKI